MRVVLASGSPRRRELLGRLGIAFESVPADLPEDIGDGGRAERAARRLAVEKARAVAAVRPAAAVIGADTVVACRGQLLGKPRDASEARAMLKMLRGPVHRVVTAVSVVAPGRRRAFVDHVVSRVRMRDYAEAEITASIARGDPFDKAGAYAIQDGRFAPVDTYEGCYCNVVGLPLWTTAGLLRRAGLELDDVGPGLPPPCALCPEREPAPAAGPLRHAGC